MGAASDSRTGDRGGRVGWVPSRRVTRAFAPNLVAAVLGCAFVLAALRRRSRRGPNADVVALVAGVFLLGSLAFPGVDGVRRWVAIGPLSVNVSELAAPWMLWSIAARSTRVANSLALTACATLVHVLQPDAGQATAFGLAAAALFATAPCDVRWRQVGCVVALGGVLLAWLRKDPLSPVEHVERIVHLAFRVGFVTGVLAILALALLVAPFAWRAFEARLRQIPLRYEPTSVWRQRSRSTSLRRWESRSSETSRCPCSERGRAPSSVGSAYLV